MNTRLLTSTILLSSIFWICGCKSHFRNEKIDFEQTFSRDSIGFIQSSTIIDRLRNENIAITIVRYAPADSSGNQDKIEEITINKVVQEISHTKTDSIDALETRDSTLVEQHSIVEEKTQQESNKWHYKAFLLLGLLILLVLLTYRLIKAYRYL